MSLAPGTTLANGRYRIDRVLGEGGMGTVYEATELALERKVALKTVRSRAGALRACYESQLASRPGLAGKITVQWTIVTDGSVSNPKTVNDSLDNKSVTDCVLRVMGGLEFAKPEAGICVIQWPFVFSPG